MLKVLEGHVGVSKNTFTALPDTQVEVLITGAVALKTCGATVNSFTVRVATLSCKRRYLVIGA
jgi:class 3 adenylate cyclase